MVLTGRLENSAEIKSPAEKFYNLWKTQIYHLPNISSDHLQSVNIHEGDRHTHEPSIIGTTEALDGEALTLKEKVKFEDNNMTLKYLRVKGDRAKDFKNLVVLLKVIPKADGNGGKVKWAIELKKASPDVAAPTSSIVMAEKVTKDADAHLFRN